MTDIKEQKLIEAQAAAACKCAEAGRKWDETYHKKGDTRREWVEIDRVQEEARGKCDEAYHKWNEAGDKLWKYRVSKAQQGGKRGK